MKQSAKLITALGGAVYFASGMFAPASAVIECRGTLQYNSAVNGCLMPVVEIDGDMVGGGQPGPVTRKLREMYISEAKNG